MFGGRQREKIQDRRFGFQVQSQFFYFITSLAQVKAILLNKNTPLQVK